MQSAASSQSAHITRKISNYQKLDGKKISTKNFMPGM